MTDAQIIDELREQINRLTAASVAANLENECLRKQIASLKANNRDPRDGHNSRTFDDVDTQTDNDTPPPGQNNNADTSGNPPRPNNDPNAILNLDLVNGILSHFEMLNVSIVLPTYDGENGNPVQFIEKLEKYFVRKKIKEAQQLLVVEDALKGRARVWYEARFNPFVTFNHFKHAFNDEFYSLEARMKFKTEWAAKKFKPNSDRSLREYFLEQTRAAKYITPRLDDYEINYTIIKQLPQRVRDALSTVNYAKSDLISQALARLDASHNETYINNASYGKPLTSQDRQKSSTNQVNYIQRNNSFGRRNNHVDQDRREYVQNRSRENWRETTRANTRPYVAIPDTSHPPPNFRNNEGTQDNEGGHEYYSHAHESHSTAQMHHIRALQQSDFIQDLCWDVEGETGEGEISEECNVVSPRMRAKVCGFYVNVLIDSGSDITCVSQQLYEALSKTNTEIPELPVSNLAVGVAVSRKTVRVNRKIFLTVKYWEFDISHTYLVVPGLATEMIVGADFLDKNGGVINFRDRTFELCGKRIPSNLISYKKTLSLEDDLEKEACRSLQLRVIEVKETNAKSMGQTAKIKQSCMGGAIDGENNKNIITLSSRVIDNRDEKIDEPYQAEAGINEYVLSLSQLDVEKKRIVRDLFLRNKRVFSDEPGRLKGYEHVIRVNHEKPFIRRSQPVAFKVKPRLDREVKKMEKMGIIRRSNSEYCNPYRVVIKKNDEIRLCLDGRWANRFICANNKSPQKIEELLLKRDGLKFFSTTDLVKGYWQISLSEESKKFTAFIYNGHVYEFNVLAFGMKDSGAAFIKALDIALGPEFDDFVSAYIDDLLITSRTFKEHVYHLDKLFKRLIDRGLTLGLKKSSFFRDSVPFLGFVLTRDGITPDPEKLEAIVKLAPPRDKQQLQSILGMCGYYRRFVISHANFVDPFRELLSEKHTWAWTDSHQEAFEALKQNFMRVVTLRHYLPETEFRVQTDASDIGISGILYQLDEENNPRIVSLVSRVLTKYERNYTVTEKELLAVIYTVLKFRYYLIGSRFKIITDHKNLTFLLTSPFNSARLTRWILCLQEYNFEISHCKGRDNIVADLFSRHFPGEQSSGKSNALIWGCVRELPELKNSEEDQVKSINLIKNLSVKPELVSELKRIKEHQRNDAQIQSLIEKKSQNHSIHSENGVHYIKNKQDNGWKLLLPLSLVLVTLRCTHEQFGHAGAFKLYSYLSRFFYWRGMRRAVKTYTKSCDICQRVKYLNCKMEGGYQFLRASKPNEMISVDFFGPLPRSVGGVEYLFVVQDVFSKFLTLYPIKRATTQICITKLTQHYFAKVGKPERILSDHGTQFTSPVWKSRLEALGVSVLFSLIRHPQSNPVERSMREIGRIFRTYCADQHTKWARYVDFVQQCINLTTHQSTGYTPYHLHFDKQPKEKILELFPMLREVPHAREFRLERANENLQKAFKTRCKTQKTVSKVKIEVGDEVMLRVPHLSDAAQRQTSKFFHIYEGPYKIARAIGENAFELVMVDNPTEVKGTYNRYNLRKYHRLEMKKL